MAALGEVTMVTLMPKLPRAKKATDDSMRTIRESVPYLLCGESPMNASLATFTGLRIAGRWTGGSSGGL
jgi:hypothetical protein